MSKTNPLIFVLAAAFGSGSWLGVNSIWMEMSLMSQKLPEGWALASCATLVLQIGCVLVVLYTCLVKCTSFRPPVVPFIQVCLIVCAVVYLPLAFLWDSTATVFGASHSWVFVLCAFVLGTINVLSNVLFVPYMCAFDTQYLVAYFIGTGVSQLLPSVVAIIQGSSQPQCRLSSTSGQVEPVYSQPLFSITVYYLVMFAFSLFSVIAFALLEKSRKSAKSESCSTQVFDRCSASNGVEKTKSIGEGAKDGPMRFVTLLLCIALSGAYFGSILPSVLSYATLPFSSATYYWAFILGQIGLAAGSFLPFCVIARSLTTTVFLTALATASTAILIAFAAASPHPWLEKSVAGSIVSIIASIVAFTLSGYLRASISAVIKDDSPNDESRLFWSGFVTQAGAFIGACIMFPLINVFEVFHSAPEC